MKGNRGECINLHKYVALRTISYLQWITRGRIFIISVSAIQPRYVDRYLNIAHTVQSVSYEWLSTAAALRL